MMRQSRGHLRVGLISLFLFLTFSPVEATILTPLLNDQTAPAVVYNPNADEYLVVYEDEPSPTNSDILAQRIAADGTPIGEPIQVATSANRESDPSVAYNPVDDEYLVVYTRAISDTDDDIHAQRISGVGMKIGDAVSITALTHAENHPAVAHHPTENEYLIVWEHRAGSGEFTHDDIRGLRVNRLAAPVGEPFVLDDTPMDESAPQVAYGAAGDRYLVIWQERPDTTGTYGIHGRMVSSTGVPLAGELAVATGDYDLINPRLAFNATENAFLVVWEDHRGEGGDDWEIYGQRVSGSGDLTGANFAIAWKIAGRENHRMRPDVACLPAANEYRVIWEYESGPVDGDLYFRRVAANGTLVEDEIALAAASASESHPVIAAGDGLTALAVWEQQPSGGDDGIDLVGQTVPLYALSGQVLAGAPGEPQTALGNVEVELFYAATDGEVGRRVYGVLTDDDGHYDLFANGICEYTNIIQIDLPDYVSIAAETSGGAVVSANWIQYSTPLAGKDTTANRFYDEAVIIDPAPLVITSGPAVVELSPHTARIQWETDKPGDSRVTYGRQAGTFSDETTDPTLLTQHETLLPGLAASTTYHFRVQSTADNGQSVQSGDITFETDPLPDDEDPTVTLIGPTLYTGIVTVAADAADNTGIEKVQFLLDGQLVHTAYGPDAAFKIDTRRYASGEHTLTARACDLAGRCQIDERLVQLVNQIDESAPTVTITAPATDGAAVSGTVNVTAALSDDTGLAHVFLKVDGVNDAYEPLPSHPKNQTVGFAWDSTLVPNGSHTLAVEVYDTDSPYPKYGYAARPVVVNQVAPALPPKLKTDHSVDRYGNYFSVTVIVTNVGGETATDIQIQDFLRGFQPISASASTPVQATYTASYDSWKHEWACTIDSSETIAANTTKNFTFFAVPVMSDSTPITPEIGFLTGVHYNADSQGLRIHDWAAVPVPQIFGGETIAQAYDEALKTADYLIVTHPNRLFAFGPTQTAAVNGLFSDMAELARYRNGVLGFMDSYDKELLRELIKPGLPSTDVADGDAVSPGEWSGRLASGWNGNGYLLLVGENQIIPAWVRKLGSRKTETGATYTWIADPADYPYANNTGEELQPELCLGRIIGDKPADLRIPIQTSLNVARGSAGYAFDRSHSLLISGFPKGLGGGAMNLLTQQEVDKVLDRILIKPVLPISDQSVWHTPAYAVYDGSGQVDQPATKAAVQSVFLADAPGQDVIFLAGHGTPNGWDALDKSSLAGQVEPFGSSNPFVFASSCETGSYTGGLRFAEAFLAKGAGAYLGAIIIGACYQGSPCPNADTFFDRWDLDEPLGLALQQTKRNLTPNFVNRIWSGIYQLYGDPKYGALTSATTTARGESATAGETIGSIEIDVPGYRVTRIDDEDHVDIPGGSSLLATGMPVVPYYEVFYDYPKGHQIQAVELIERSGEMTEAGLSLPVGILGVLGCCEPQFEALPETVPVWWPEKSFEWRVIDGPDAMRLAITVFPFTYNHQTGDSVFHSHFRFDVIDELSAVRVVQLRTDRPVYGQGEPVVVSVTMQNAGPAQDVIVEAVIAEEGSEEAVAGGLFLRTLKAFEGRAAWSDTWDSAAFPPGYYHIRTTIKATQGTVLERKTETFRLGVSAARVEEFSVAPAHFTIGDPIQVSLSVFNSGTVELNGTAVVDIQGASGESVHEFRQEVSQLAPGQIAALTAEWDTTGFAPGTYQLVGYMMYDGMATDPATRLISTSSCLNDHDHDGDVDGRDLAEFLSIAGAGPADLIDFGEEFGRSDCLQP